MLRLDDNRKTRDNSLNPNFRDFARTIGDINSGATQDTQKRNLVAIMRIDMGLRKSLSGS